MQLKMTQTERYTMLRDQKNIVKVSVLPKAIYTGSRKDKSMKRKNNLNTETHTHTHTHTRLVYNNRGLSN